MASPPNIVIFNPDQWRGDVMGHLGNPAASTPVLDQLVSEDGVSFRNAFCQNPVCTPSRCSFMTGWYPHVRGHRTMHHMLHTECGEPNLLQVLKEHGYFVWWGGKNDLIPGGQPLDAVCDVRYRADSAPMWQVDRAAEWRGAPGSDSFYSFYVGKLPHTDGYDHYHDSDWANVLGAVEFLRHYDGQQPFCIFLSLTYPHPPYAVEEPWYSRIDRPALPPRAPAPSGWHGKPAILPGIAAGQGLTGWTEERWRELRAAYYGMCSRVDAQAGLVLDALAERGVYDDTAFFLFADHGDFTGDYGLVEKTQNTFEECLTHVPFVVKPPRDLAVQAGIRDALVELIDFPATVYDLAGIVPEYTHFGRSLTPLLRGETAEHRDAVFCEGGRLHGERQAMELESDQDSRGLYSPRLRLQATDEAPYHGKATMCRTDRYKYVHRLYEPDELYDLAHDPQELHNVAGDAVYGPVLESLRERLLTWYQETCDIVPRATDRRW